MSHLQGATLEIPVSFRLPATGEPYDPATVAVTVRSPAGTSTTYTYPSGDVVKDGVGEYRALITPNEPGDWRFEWEPNVGDGSFRVRASLVDDPTGPLWPWVPIPTVEQIASLLHVRTAVNGEYRGTFDDDTFPTRAQVQEIARIAANDLSLRLLTAPTGEQRERTQYVASLRAAALIETSYFADEQSSALTQYNAMFLDALAALGGVTTDEDGGTTSPAVMKTVVVRGVGAAESEALDLI